jgi:translation initiation factor 6
MGIAKATIGNNSYIGAFALATDSYAVVAANSTKSERSIIEENLGCKAVPTTVDGSDLVGVYAIANARGILLPEMADRVEISLLKKHLPGVVVDVIPTGLNALRNNILANDKLAIINPEYSRMEAGKIGETLGVEVIKRRIGSFGTVGANNIITNKGIVVNNSATDDDIEFAKGLGLQVSQTTANLGSLSIGLSAVANSKGAVVGDQTTGFELARISEGLDIE